MKIQFVLRWHFMRTFLAGQYNFNQLFLRRTLVRSDYILSFYRSED